MSESKPLPEKSPPARAPRLLPGYITWTIFSLFVLALIWVRVTDPFGDEAIVNVLTLILGFFATMTLLLWLMFVSNYSRVARYSPIAVAVAGIALFFVFNRIERVSGSLLPTFRARFAPPRDATLEKPVVADAGAAVVDLKTTTPDDFPQFLGPDRNAVISAKLDHDWEKHPPKQVWKQDIGAGWSGFAVVNGFAVTMEQRGDEELVTCYEVATGKLRWSHSQAGRHSTVLGGVGPRSTPTIHEGNVYVMGVLGTLLCLNGEDGRPLWSVDLIKRFGTTRETDDAEVAWGRAASPLIVDDLVVVPAGGPPDKPVSLAAFDKQTGELKWQGGQTQISYASPTLATLCGVRQILSVNESNVSGHDPETGKVLWQADWPGDSSANATASQPQTPGDDRVLLSKGYSVGAKMLKVSKDDDAWSTDLLWDSMRVMRTKFTNVAIVDNYAYDLNDSLLECVNLTDGKHAWRGKRYGQGQILVAGDVILVMTENDGDVVVVSASPKKFEELGRFTALEGLTWNTLCLAGKYLLVRNSQEAACYELKLRDP